jgi:tetratricopeptide (TPR) repeat protein
MVENSPSASSASGPRGRRLLPGLVLLALVSAAVGGIWLWRARLARHEPPSVDVTNSEPGVAKAVRLAREQVLKRPRSADAWGTLGQVLIANEMEDDALPCFVEAERLNPSDPRWPYYEGGIILNHGDRQTAVTFFRRAVERSDPDSDAGVTARLLLAETLLNGGDNAETEVREVMERHPNNTRAHFAMAMVATSRQAWEESRTHLLACLDSRFARQKARIQLAPVCERLGRASEGERYRSEAEHLPPDVPWVDPWISEYLRLSELKRNRYRIMETLEQAGRLKEAIDAVRPITQRFPDDHLALLALGKLLAQTKEFDDGERALRRSIELAPDVVQGHYYLSLLLLHKGEELDQNGAGAEAQAAFAEAEKQAREALQVKSDYGFAYMTLGLSLRKMRRVPEAVAALRQATTCNPEFAELHLYYGEVLADDGKPEEARSQFEQAARLAEPGDTRPQMALHRLANAKSKN